MYDEDKLAASDDNSKRELGNFVKNKRGRQNESEGDSIRRRKENKKKRHEKLIETLERKAPKIEESSHNGKEEKRLKTVFEVQEENKILTGRPYTVSLALAGSILDNAQSAELRTYLAGQVARALSIFCIDEVVIFDDEHEQIKAEKDQSEEDEYNSESRGCLQLNRILLYLECPQYLRKHFFAIHRDLQYAGVLNPTDMPHHVRANEISEYREGVVLENSERSGSLINVGLKKNCAVDKTLSPGLRVTVQLDLLNGKI